MVHENTPLNALSRASLDALNSKVSGPAGGGVPAFEEKEAKPGQMTEEEAEIRAAFLDRRLIMRAGDGKLYIVDQTKDGPSEVYEPTFAQVRQYRLLSYEQQEANRLGDQAHVDFSDEARLADSDVDAVLDQMMEGDEEPPDPETFEEALDRMLAMQRELMLERHRKYGKKNIQRGGPTGVFYRLMDKYSRLEEHYLEGKGDAFDDESLMDTWMDLANYSIIWQLLIEGMWMLPMEGKKDG